MKLSIQVSLNGLSFCILNTESNTIVYYHKKIFDKELDPINLLQKIEEEYNTQSQLKTPVNEVKLCFCNTLFTLVPKKWFQEDAAASYLKFNTKILKTDFVAIDEIDDNQIVNIYIPYTNILNYFFEKYGEFEYSHHLSILLHKFLSFEDHKGIKIYAHNRNKQLDLFAIEDGKLLVCNSFSYSTGEDYLYYLLFIAEQLNLDPKKFSLNLSGEIHKEDEIYKLLQDYIQHIIFLSSEISYEIEEGWNINKSEEYILLNTL
ncbi:DUF3822 family protein [Zunongwangia sp. HGR-M22]|uniref:DUF3822 family protein n=1 Tax=Zunongwangia sp. HGR-M22 TaxID=3015168 RepID=UPI0022DD5CE6|nr:DUF3822 family protein [Zunongwangia sp. HGR-M22]WBL24422.1 DUF3822 family protein [Zunongwangia sp. HGR-M22]